MTPHDLKNSVWQLAVQGKLVDQRSDEGTGAELFQQIQVEKQAQIKAGKIKKEKPLPEITEDEKTFDLPDGWCWARLATICSLITDGTHKTPSYTTNGVRFLSVKDISGGYFDLSNTKFISENEHAQLAQRCKPENGDVLICRIGTLGKALAIDIDLDFSIFVSLGLIKPINKELAKYIETVINSGYGFSWIQKVKVGGGTHTFKINLDDLRMFPIPLPPLAEQKRIVAKLEEILPLIDRYEAAWNKLEEFNKRFPGDMQKAILQLAIQGKLVEQRPEEGTGEEQFQQIQAEKQAMIKSGKIKKGKVYPAISEDEIPFEIPDTWVWVRLQDVVYNRGQKVPSKTFCYIDIGSIDNKKQKLNAEDNVLEVNKAPSRARKIVQLGDILYATVRPYLHNMCIIDRAFSFEPIASTGFAAMTCFEGVYNKYLFYYLLSPSFDNYANDTENSKGVAYPAINDDRLYRAVVPLPPLEEQKRIVAKLEEILPLCDRLK